MWFTSRGDCDGYTPGMCGHAAVPLRPPANAPAARSLVRMQPAHRVYYVLECSGVQPELGAGDEAANWCAHPFRRSIRPPRTRARRLWGIPAAFESVGPRAFCHSSPLLLARAPARPTCVRPVYAHRSYGHGRVCPNTRDAREPGGAARGRIGRLQGRSARVGAPRAEKSGPHPPRDLPRPSQQPGPPDLLARPRTLPEARSARGPDRMSRFCRLSATSPAAT